MLNEVKRLCKNDFTGLVKEYEIWQLDLYTRGFKLATFSDKKEAKEFLKNKELEAAKNFDKFTAFKIKEVKYEH